MGSFYPSLLEPRRRIDRVLWAVVMEAYVHGVSTRKVAGLAAALDIDAGFSKGDVTTPSSQFGKAHVAAIDEDLGGSVTVPLTDPLDGESELALVRSDVADRHPHTSPLATSVMSWPL